MIYIPNVSQTLSKTTSNSEPEGVPSNQLSSLSQCLFCFFYLEKKKDHAAGNSTVSGQNKNCHLKFKNPYKIAITNQLQSFDAKRKQDTQSILLTNLKESALKLKKNLFISIHKTKKSAGLHLSGSKWLSSQNILPCRHI
jgi:hypothetical protein